MPTGSRSVDFHHGLLSWTSRLRMSRSARDSAVGLRPSSSRPMARSSSSSASCTSNARHSHSGHSVQTFGGVQGRAASVRARSWRRDARSFSPVRLSPAPMSPAAGSGRPDLRSRTSHRHGVFVAADTTFVVDNPQTGLFRLAIQGDWTNGGLISAHVTVERTVNPLGAPTAPAGSSRTISSRSRSILPPRFRRRSSSCSGSRTGVATRPTTWTC